MSAAITHNIPIAQYTIVSKIGEGGMGEVIVHVIPSSVVNYRLAKHETLPSM